MANCDNSNNMRRHASCRGSFIGCAATFATDNRSVKNRLPSRSTCSTSASQRCRTNQYLHSPAKKKEHRLILQVNSNDPAAMNNATNVVQHYDDIGEKVKI
jgi:hypothetical protein